MIDPLEVVLQELRSDGALAALVGDRIAAKHRYGADAPLDVAQGAPGWSGGEAGLMVRLDGGEPELYGPLQNVRLEVRCYASSQRQAMQIWRRLVEISRNTDRVEVDTGDGVGLLHELLQASGPSFLYDDTVGMDFVLSFFNASVGEESVE